MVADAIPGRALELFGLEIVAEGEAAVRLVCAFSVVDVAVVLGGTVNRFSAASAVKIPPDVPQPYQTVSPLLNSSFHAEGEADPLHKCQRRQKQGREYRWRILNGSEPPTSKKTLPHK